MVDQILTGLGLRWLLTRDPPPPPKRGRHRATPGDPTPTPETTPAEYLYPRVRVKRASKHRWED